MLFALVDCNNFYVSCERAFNPKLENNPVVILSNNDGCVISRSNEAKRLKIPMGAPFFQWEAFFKKHKVIVFSSNYELYGDMSQRVMFYLKEFNEQMEVYSIDEAFLLFNGDVSFSALVELRNKVKACTGIPISIGVGSTKTLAKAANHIAKTADSSGVFFLSDSELYRLAEFSVDKIWGVGRRLAERLSKLHVTTAKKLQEADPKMIRQHFSVTLEKTVKELNGISCLGLEQFQPRKQIVTSRSFGKVVTKLSELEEAVSFFTHVASKKLRSQKSLTSAVYVFVQTNPFKESEPQYANSVTFSLPSPSADTCYLIEIAKKCLRRIYREGYQYKKAGIMLLNITSNQVRQYDMLMSVSDDKSDRLMRTMDSINANFGRNTVFVAAEGIQKKWAAKCDRRSKRYTTRWQELVQASCL